MSNTNRKIQKYLLRRPQPHKKDNNNNNKIQCLKTKNFLFLFISQNFGSVCISYMYQKYHEHIKENKLCKQNGLFCFLFYHIPCPFVLSTNNNNNPPISNDSPIIVLVSRGALLNFCDDDPAFYVICQFQFSKLN